MSEKGKKLTLKVSLSKQDMDLLEFARKKKAEGTWSEFAREAIREKMLREQGYQQVARAYASALRAAKGEGVGEEGGGPFPAGRGVVVPELVERLLAWEETVA